MQAHHFCHRIIPAVSSGSMSESGPGLQRVAPTPSRHYRFPHPNCSFPAVFGPVDLPLDARNLPAHGPTIANLR